MTGMWAVAGFFRKLPDAEGPKYRNSSETKLYSKSKVLYGLNFAKDAIVRADEVIVCEGYTDVIGFAAAGVPRAVATCGTSLTEDHIRVLKRFTNRIVLAYDADEAGLTFVALGAGLEFVRRLAVGRPHFVGRQAIQ